MVSHLVGNSFIGKSDHVLEIGAGSGAITQELLHVAGDVLSIEIDLYWCKKLREKFANERNLTLHHADFLTYSLPKFPYKVFANIPFSIEGKIIRKLIDSSNPPLDCYLVVNEKLAKRLIAENAGNLFSTLHKPWFDFSIIHRFSRSDFSPKPNVDAVLFRFNQKIKPLLPIECKVKYSEFICKGYGNGNAVRTNVKKTHSLEQLDKALHDFSIQRKARPSQLSCEQWIALFSRLTGFNR